MMKLAVAALTSGAIVTGMPLAAQAEPAPESATSHSEFSAELAKELGLAGLSRVEVQAELESQGFELDADSNFSKELGKRISLKIAAPEQSGGDESAAADGEYSTKGVGIRFDPLPYLVGTGKDWTELSKGGAAAVAAAVCSPAGLVAGVCGAVTKMILDGFGDPDNLPNAKDCYVMKNFNLPPEKVARSVCG
jgi:hypothetical protein